MNETRLFQVGGFGVHVPVAEAARAERLLFRGGFTCPKLAHDGAIRRVLDVSPGWGAFAIWSAHRWPYAWVDCVGVLGRNPILEENAPMGARVIQHITTEQYDVVHCTARGGFAWWSYDPAVVVVEGERGSELDAAVLNAVSDARADYSLAFADFDGPLAVLTFVKGTQ